MTAFKHSTAWVYRQTGCNIGVILISSIVWDKFLTKNGLREPIPILFPRYSRSTSPPHLPLASDLPDERH